MRARAAVVLAVAGLAVAGCGGDDAPEPGGETRAPAGGPVRPGDFLSLQQVADGFDQPLGLVPAPGSDDLYVVEQPGRVRPLGSGGPGPALIDIRASVLSGGEQGLLGLAFHPGYARNGRLFLHYTNRDGDTRVDEYRARAGRADPATRRELLAVDQPYPNHNGGQLSFGPDGLLYLGLGDGGSAFDPHDNGQDPGARLAKILRIDVDSPDSDWEPAAYGLRNPRRFSWDRRTGSLWIADVGQDEREEVDVVTELGNPPPNFGWPAFEGGYDLDEREPSGPGRLIFPVAEYEHGDEGHCSITGGYVYRGREVPEMRGRYVYADVCSGTIWTLRAGRESAGDVRREDDELEQLASFGEDLTGELYAVSLAGGIFRLRGSD
jgi:glucose/arabinose dehydrogenase